MDAAISDQNTRLHALTVKYDVMADTPDKPLGYEIITKMRSVQGILTIAERSGHGYSDRDLRKGKWISAGYAANCSGSDTPYTGSIHWSRCRRLLTGAPSLVR